MSIGNRNNQRVFHLNWLNVPPLTIFICFQSLLLESIRWLLGVLVLKLGGVFVNLASSLCTYLTSVFLIGEVMFSSA